MLNKIFPKRKVGASSDIKLEVPSPDYIPYACHYSPETILTKNGELLQVIKITGFYNEKIGSQKFELRDLIRQAVADNIKNDNFALWFHTVRRKQNLDPGGDFAPDFSISLNTEWKKSNNWENQYVNEVYISVIRDGASIGIINPAEILKSVFFSSLKKRHDQFLSKANAELTEVVDGMLRTLGEFGALRLKIVETKEGFFSDQARFFAKILNLNETPVPVPVRDLSEYLANSPIAFGFNTMEVRGRRGKYFGAMFTLKEAHEIPGTSLDHFLQLPQEFIITQTLDFINSRKALKDFRKQYYILKVSGSEDFSDAMGLSDIVESDLKSSISFGNSQTTIFLISSTLQMLEKHTYDATEALKKLGMVATRRDLRMEECFWAQLPANFSNISRLRPIITSRAGALASLYNFPAGSRSGNLWGPAVTAFHTVNGTPYFFNFHKGDNGNTTILGPNGSGKTVLMNFLVSEARKFNCRLFFFDQLRASKVFIRSMGGGYSVIKPLEPNKEYAFNPFSMEDTPKNRDFLKRWIIYVAEASGIKCSEGEALHLGKLVDYVFSLPKEQRRLSKMAGHFGGNNAVGLEKRMAPWHSGGQYAHLFDNEGSDITSFKGAIYGFGMSYIIQDQASLGPVLSYLLYTVESVLDGTPTMIVLDEAWKLINNPLFAPGIEDWLDRMKANNAIVIFASENIKNASTSELSNKIADKIATQIFLPNPNAEESSRAYKDVWGLSEEEFEMLASMNNDRREFMLRQGDVSIVASLDLSGMKELDVLSGSDKTVIIMDEVIAKVGPNPEDWLPAFYERMMEIKGAQVNENEKLFII